MKNWKAVLAFMVLVAVLMASSYTMLVPFLPVYLVAELGADADSVNLWSGAVFAVTFAISAVVAPLWGRLSDRTGRKLMMLRSSILLAVAYFLGGIVQTPFQLFLMRVVQGFAAGLWPACLAMLSAYVPKNRLGIAMGLMQSANICGGIIGPLLGGVLATAFGMRDSFFVGAGALSFITVITILFIREPPREKPQPAPAAEGPKKKIKPQSLLKDRGILALMIAAGFTSVVMMQVQPIMTVYVASFDEVTKSSLMMLSGAIFSLGGLAGAIAAPQWGRVGQKRGFFYTMVISFCLAGVASCLQGIPRTLWVFALFQFVFGLCFAGIFPSANSLLVLLTPASRRGESFALFFAAQQFGGAAGPILGGLIATVIAPRAVFFTGGALLLCIGITVFLRCPSILNIMASDVGANDNGSGDYINAIKAKAQSELEAERRKAAGGGSNEGR
jgi:DHA1 family multidrug resistance protein-like MFS transporter